MKRMKTFLIYLILVIVVILSTDFIAEICLQSGYKPIPQYEIATTSPKIEVVEAKTTKANGVIKGDVTNTTNTLQQNLFLKIELLSDIGNKLGTEYLQIGNLQPEQKKEFELKYRYSNVSTFVISTTSEKTEEILEYHPLIEHAGTYYLIARFIVFVTTPGFFLLAPFIK